MKKNTLNGNSSQRIIEVLSLAIGTEACLVMVGWIFSIDFLTRILPSGINMKFLTALMFFFSAIALYLIFRLINDEYELSSVLLPGIALSLFLIMGVILLAGLTNTQIGLMASLSGTQTGIENLFVREESPIYGAGSGLPSMVTMANFIAFGIICISSLFHFSNQQKLFKFIGCFIVIISSISIAGYLFSLPFLYFEIYDWTPIALNTALLFLLLGTGLIVISKVKMTHEV